jgi:hypothetical protein
MADARIRAAHGGVDDDAVLAIESARLGQRFFGHRADAHDQLLDGFAHAVDRECCDTIAVELEMADRGADPQLDARSAVRRQHVRGDFGRSRTRQQARCRLDHRHRQAERTRTGRDLEPDEATAEHGDARRRRESRAQALRIGGVAHERKIGQRLAPAGNSARARAGGEHQMGVGQHDARAQAHALRHTIDRHGRVGAVQRDAVFGIPGFSAVQWQGLERTFQKALRQRRALVRQFGFLAHQMHTPALSGLDQAGAQLRGGMAAADDHDGLRIGHRLTPVQGSAAGVSGSAAFGALRWRRRCRPRAAPGPRPRSPDCCRWRCRATVSEPSPDRVHCRIWPGFVHSIAGLQFRAFKAPLSAARSHHLLHDEPGPGSLP